MRCRCAWLGLRWNQVRACVCEIGWVGGQTDPWQVHFIDGILNAQRYRDEILRPIVVPFIHDHHRMLQHDNARPLCCKDLYTIPGSWKHHSSCMASILTGHVTHWAYLGFSGLAYTTACTSSWQYPATSHSHWRGVDQHSTGHNQQPDQLYANSGHTRYWLVFGPLTPPPQYSKTSHFRVAFYWMNYAFI